MATDLAAPATQTLNSTPLGTFSGVLQGGINSLANSGSNLLDRFFPPQRRNEVKASLMKFATEKPQLASFLLSQLALSGGPVFLFVVMTIGVLVFALLAGLVVGLVGALLFTVVCAGFALIILLPTLFVTTFAAAFIWLWGMGAYYIIKWFNEKPVPGVHKTVGDGVMEQTGLQGIQNSITGALNGEPKLPPAYEQDPSSRPDQMDDEKNGDHPDAPATKPPPRKLPPHSEKKDGTNAPPKLRTESPIGTKSPIRSVKTTGNDVANVGGELKKKTGPVGNVAGGLTGAAGIAA